MEFRFIESLHNKANQRNLNFWANSSRLLRKLDHVLLWILSNDTKLLQCSLCADQRKFQWLAMFCFYTLPIKPKFKCWQLFAVLWSCFLEMKLIWVIFTDKWDCWWKRCSCGWARFTNSSFWSCHRFHKWNSVNPFWRNNTWNCLFQPDILLQPWYWNLHIWSPFIGR